MKQLQTLVISFVLLLFGTEGAAQSPQSPFLNPRLTVLPAMPTPGTPFDLRIRDTTGVVPTVLESSLTVTEAGIEIRASIQLGYIDFSEFYEIAKTVPQMAAGLHSVKYFARTKRPDTDLTDYFLEQTWQVFIVEPQDVVSAVEYFNPPRNHYFLTADADEIAALDANVFEGWGRTGEAIRVLRPATFPTQTFAVCRFYGVPSANLDTHFYSGTDHECDLLKQEPQSWLLERTDAFRVGQISFSDGACPANMIRVFRLWNGSAAVNHRYTTSSAIQQQMLSQGWVAEGSGNPPAVWCALP